MSDTTEQLGPAFRTVSGPRIEALRALKDEARTRWRMSHVVLDTAARRAAAGGEQAEAIEAHAGHLDALLDWRDAEAQFVAARLGFRIAAIESRDGYGRT
jgi:hypothetical protein